MVTEIDLAYVAGLFDGDGCVYIHKSKPDVKHRTKNPTYQIAVAIANTNQKILYEIQRMFGGHLRRESKPEKEVHAQMYQWGANTRIAQSFLEMIVPYLRIKKEQAQLALLFYDFKDMLKRGECYSPINIALLEQLRLKVSELKRNAAKKS